MNINVPSGRTSDGADCSKKRKNHNKLNQKYFQNDSASVVDNENTSKSFFCPIKYYGILHFFQPYT